MHTPRKLILSLACLAMTHWANAQSLIVCEPEVKGKTGAAIWPVPFISKNAELCFDVKGWPEYSGKNCVKNGGSTSWTGLVIVWVDGESEGRDSTHFRVVKPTINKESIQYVIEWSRDGKWQRMQDVNINRLTGTAASRSVKSHGSDSFQCHLQKPKL